MHETPAERKSSVMIGIDESRPALDLGRPE